MRALLLSFVLICAVTAAAAPVADATPLTRDDFVTALTADLVRHFNLEGDLQLELLRPWAAPARLARKWAVEVTEYPSLPATSMLVRCRVLADGEPAADCTVTLRALLWRDAWAARQPLAANAAFDAAALEARRVDFFRERDALSATVGDHDFRFVRSIQPGRLLTWRDVARRPLVRKGDVVEVAAIDGLLQITMKGLAMESGAAGDTVTIRNQESRKDFAAQVVAENRVQIRF
ncbi:MAG: flagellar basal body P-ring formation protein FlgA [Opitutae bacterium]|nr:flagellar basal body P-ring formation protein FlgA [Opitutae bacterium]